mmetsp:Transcript_93971/g.129436  ORF Transcript_93971/g.129436 Transcript_93971/m.129436 type:complete len:140 (-) Transcript_93971:959-1378(-)
MTTEAEALKLSGIPISHFDRRDVVLNHKNMYVRTIEVGKKTNPTLVIIHGYLSSSAQFFPIMKKLAESFHCFYIDQLGYGCSSKVNCFDYDAFDNEETDLYHSGWIEAWRIAVGDITNFYLMGHNYGGYAAGLYASINP